MSSEPAVPDLGAHLGYWLRFVSNHVSHSFARKLEGKGVTVAEWVLLRDLYDHAPVEPARVAERLSLTRGAISKLAERLIAKSLITRKAHQKDARSHLLSLTVAGGALVPLLAALADENETEFFGHLPERDRNAIGRIMKGLVDKHGLRSIPSVENQIMNATPQEIAIKCLEASEKGTMTFPQIVGTLIEAGFESYLIDFRRAMAIYYRQDGESVEIPAHRSDTAIAAAFDAVAIQAAIREAQQLVPGYTYLGFCEKVGRAGCAGYIVSFSGRRAVYFGRTAEMHVELFPQD